MYKEISTAEKKKQTLVLQREILPTYQKAKSLLAAGKQEEAQAIVDGLSEDEYKAYQSVNKQFKKDQDAAQGEKPTYEDGEVQTPKTLINTVTTYAKAIGVDPATAFKAIFTDEKLKYVDGNVVVLERIPLKESQKIKKERESANADFKLDHTIPLELGGDNSEGNLAIVPTALHASYSPVENALGTALRSKRISIKTARKLIQDFKAGRLTAEQVYAEVK